MWKRFCNVAGLVSLAGLAPLATVLWRGRPESGNLGIWLATLVASVAVLVALTFGVWLTARAWHGSRVSAAHLWLLADGWVIFGAFMVDAGTEAAVATRPEIVAGIWAYMGLKLVALGAISLWPRGPGANARPASELPPGRRLAGAALAFALVAFLLYAVFEPLLAPVPSDFRVNYLGARTALDGGDPYVDRQVRSTAQRLRIPYDSLGLWNQVTNPPTALAMFAGLAVMPFAAAVNLWLALNLIAALVLLATLRGLIPRAPPLWWGLAAALLASFWALHETLRLGQVDVLIALAVTGAAVLIGRRHDAAAGGLIAFAAGMKILPAVFLVYALAMRRWRVLGGFAVVLGLMFLLSIAVLGPDTWSSYFEARVPGLARGTALWNNLSISGFFNRLVLGSTEARTNWWVISDAPLARVLGSVWSLVIVAVTVRHFWRARTIGALDWGLAATAIILAGSVAWPHYLLWTAPALAALATLDSRLLAGGRRIWRPAALIVGSVLVAVDWPAYYEAWRPVFEASTLLLNLRNIGVVLIFLALWRAARESISPAPRAATEANAPRR